MKETTQDIYRSRVCEEWEIAEREDPAAHGDSDGPLGRDEVESFAAEGFLFKERVFAGAEVRALCHEVDRICRHARDSDGVIREPGSDVVRSVFRVHRDAVVRARVCLDPRIVAPVRQLLGSDVYIHQSRVNFKPAFDGKEFFWHSDFETWHIEDGMPRMRAVSVAINLTETNEFNGPLMVIPKSHLKYVRCAGATPADHYKESLRKQEYGVPSREALEALVRDGGIHAPKGPPGSALFFDCNAMHGSGGNLSPFPRAGLFIVYNSVENALTEPFGGLPPRPDFLAEREVEPV
jgi:ectoine hydroxylase